MKENMQQKIIFTIFLLVTNEVNKIIGSKIEKGISSSEIDESKIEISVDEISSIVSKSMKGTTKYLKEKRNNLTKEKSNKRTGIYFRNEKTIKNTFGVAFKNLIKEGYISYVEQKNKISTPKRVCITPRGYIKGAKLSEKHQEYINLFRIIVDKKEDVTHQITPP
jgi:hypothetical protein